MGISNQLELKYVKDMHPCNLHFNNKMLWEALFWRRLAPQSLLTQMYKAFSKTPSPGPGLWQEWSSTNTLPFRTDRKTESFPTGVTVLVPCHKNVCSWKHKSELRDEKLSHEGKLNEELQLRSQFLRDAEVPSSMVLPFCCYVLFSW